MKKLLLSLTLLLAACGSDSTETTAVDESAAVPHPLESRWLVAPPAGAVEVNDLRSLEDGAAVVVRGDVRDYTAVQGKAVLTLIDHSLLSCDEMGEEDHCPTPWDFCCEDSDKVNRSTAVVEFREEGKLVAAKLGGFHGLDYLADVVVTGTLGIDDAGNLRVVASGIHVE